MIGASPWFVIFPCRTKVKLDNDNPVGKILDIQVAKVSGYR